MLKKITLIFLSGILLNGCVGAFVAGAVIGGAVIYEGRNIHTQKNDLALTNTANRQLAQSHAFSKQSHVVISVYSGVVLLAGQTPTTELKKQAEEILQGVPGVRRVYNEISISGPISPMTQSSDAWITTKVKSKLLTVKDLDSSAIKVTTENGVVYLMGQTTPKQAKIAANGARTVTGVQKVVTLFEHAQ